jgi:hypothetical protein
LPLFSISAGTLGTLKITSHFNVAVFKSNFVRAPPATGCAT